MASGQSSFLTVIVCSHNGESRIAQTLKALDLQTVKVPVIVVDDGSTDNTASVVRSSSPDVELLVSPTNIGLSAARNLGLNSVQSDFVAFCDDDCRPSPKWIEHLIEAWRNTGEGIMAIGGDVMSYPQDSVARRYLETRRILTPLELATYTSLRHRIKRQFLPPRNFKAGETLGSVVGANMSFRMGALRSIGCFNEEIRFGGDEEFVSVKLREHFGSGCIEFVPNVTMPHQFDATLRQQWRRDWRYGLGVGRKFVREGGLPALPLPLGVAILVGLCVGLGVSWFVGVDAAILTAYVSRSFEAFPGWPLERLLYPFFSVIGQILSLLGICVGVVKNIVRSSR